MISVDTDYFVNTYGGTESTDTSTALKYAEMVTRSLVIVSPETDSQISAYKTAVCVQAEYILSKGDTSAWLSGSISSVSIGSFSYSANSSSESSQSTDVSSLAVDILDKAGLLYRGGSILWD